MSDAPGDDPTESWYWDTPTPLVQVKGAAFASDTGIVDPFTGQAMVAGEVLDGGLANNVMVDDVVSEPLVPVTVKVYVVCVSTEGTVMSSELEPGDWTVAGPNEALAPGGSPATDRLTWPVKLFPPPRLS
jgi:hypothetical protein